GPRHSVSSHGGEDNVQRHTHHGNKHAVQQGAPDGRVGEDDLIVDQGEAGGDNLPAGHAGHQGGVGQAFGHQVEHGDQDDHQDKEYDRVDQHGGGKRKFPLFLVRHSLPRPLSGELLRGKVGGQNQ